MMIVRIVGMEVLGLELVCAEEGDEVLKQGARTRGGESVGPFGVTTGCASGLGGVTSTGTVTSEEEAAAKPKPAALRASAPNMAAAAARLAPAETGVHSMATLPKPTRGPGVPAGGTYCLDGAGVAVQLMHGSRHCRHVVAHLGALAHHV
eukprot:2201602-Rhodomonas_salina.1